MSDRAPDDLLRQLVDLLDELDAGEDWARWRDADPVALTTALERHAERKRHLVALRAEARAWLDQQP